MVTSRNDTPPPAAHSRTGADPGLVDAIAQLSFLVQNALAEIAGAHDLSLIQTRLLGILRDREPTMNELGRHLGLDKSSITGLVSRAQQRGLVARTVSAIDRRVARVSITGAGRDLVVQIAERFAERIADLVAALEDADRQDFSRLASQIVLADMRRHGIDPGNAEII
jgi:DNA-binding MarR family transcriptional regulator